MRRRYSLGKRSPSAWAIIRQAGTNWVPADDARARLQERDAREAADTRTPVQRWLGDPPANRSALAQSTQQDPTPQ
jgi:hypothetical protein